MVAALAVLYREGNLRHGWPYQLADADGQAGFGYHRMGVATACPCDVRLNMRPEIIRRAAGAAQPPLEEDADMILIRKTTGEVSVFNGAVRKRVGDPQTLAAYQNAGLQLADITDRDYDSIPPAEG